MAEVTLADLQQMLAATAAANKATAEAGQLNAQRISEINSALDKLALSQQEIFRTSTRVESTMPAKCSTLGFSPNGGGAEVGFLSMQPEDSSADQELAYGSDNATSSPDAVVPAKCSTLSLSPNVGGVEAMDLLSQSGIVSTVSPGPVGAPLPSSMQQFGILKPDKHMPTTCSTGVLDINTDAKSAKRDAVTLQAGLVSIRDVAVPLPATTPPHPPDQPGLLLGRPPPWPLWMASCSPSTTHRCTLLLPVLSVSLVSCSMTTSPSSTMTRAAVLPSVRPWMVSPLRVESKQEHHHLFWLLLLSACGQAECLGGVNGMCTSSIAPPHISTPLPEHVPEPAPPPSTAGHKIVKASPGSPPLQGNDMMITCKSLIWIKSEISAVLSLRFLCTLHMEDLVDKLRKSPWVLEVQAVRGQFKCPRMSHYYVSTASTEAHERICLSLIVDMTIEQDLRFKVEYTCAISSKEIQCSYCASKLGFCRRIRRRDIPLLPGTVPTDAWSMISLDFVEGLPRSGKYDCILVVIDKFTKYGHFTPLSHPYTALTLAEKFIDTIYRLHGLPSVIIMACPNSL